MAERNGSSSGQTVHVGAVDSVGLVGSVQVASRHYLASEHLWTALHNARRCRELETGLAGKRHIDREHRSCASTSILTAVAFLEALVNETYADAADPRHLSHRVKALAPEVRVQMAQLRHETSPLDDLQIPKMFGLYVKALDFAGAKPFDRGAQPYQDAALLVRLRNALIHFEPSWHNNESPLPLERRLEGKFSQSGLLPMPSGSPWVPIKALGAGGAEWACKSARIFADAWTERLGIVQQYKADLEESGVES